jgi:dihydropteroate synthase
MTEQIKHAINLTMEHDEIVQLSRKYARSIIHDVMNAGGQPIDALQAVMGAASYLLMVTSQTPQDMQTNAEGFTEALRRQVAKLQAFVLAAKEINGETVQ